MMIPKSSPFQLQSEEPAHIVAYVPYAKCTGDLDLTKVAR